MAANNTSKAWGNASIAIKKIVKNTVDGVNKEVSSRAYRASNELRNASLRVLSGHRSGRTYRVPYTKRTYIASAPGESPANRTGVFRLSWGTHIHVEKTGTTFKAVSAIESNVMAKGELLGEMLEHGTSRMKPRPYKQKVRDMAMPKIKEIYDRPYKL